jgi:hypothetical protein
MSVKFQIVVGVHDPVREAAFWAAALGYRPELPPEGFDSREAYGNRIGPLASEPAGGTDSIVDPDGRGPRIWSHQMPEERVRKSRLHLAIGVSEAFGIPISTRKARVEGEAARLVRLGAERLEALEMWGLEHCAVAMTDLEGNEFVIN